MNSTSIGRENIDIVLYRISTKITDTTTTKTYYNRVISDEGILVIHKETRQRLLSLLIVNDNQENECISNSQMNFVPVLYISKRIVH